MRIAVDIDGVLRDSQCYAVEQWNKQNPDRPFQLEDWINHRSFYDLTGGPKQSFEWWVANGVFSDAPLVKHAKAGLKILEENNEIIIVSSQNSHPDIAKITTDWLHKHEIYPTEIHYCYDKSNVPYDIIIDDKPEYILQAIVNGAHAAFMKWPWNNQVADLDFKYIWGRDDMIMVVDDWDDLLKQFEARGIL